MKTIFASTILAATLVSGAAFAGPETTHNGIPVLSTVNQPYVSSNAPVAGQLALASFGSATHEHSADPARNANTGK